MRQSDQFLLSFFLVHEKKKKKKKKKKKNLNLKIIFKDL
jgi:hypothetical protein